MRPAPIPDDVTWPGAKRMIISAPDGDLTNPDIAPVEAMVDCDPETGTHRISVRCVLEDGEFEQLLEGGVVWLTVYGALPPFSLRVTRGTN